MLLFNVLLFVTYIRFPIIRCEIVLTSFIRVSYCTRQIKRQNTRNQQQHHFVIFIYKMILEYLYKKTFPFANTLKINCRNIVNISVITIENHKQCFFVHFYKITNIRNVYDFQFIPKKIHKI